MAAQWLVYKDKDEIKLPETIEFPFEATNFNRKKRTCKTKDELFKFLICRKEVKAITLMLTAKVHPNIFITEDSYQIVQHYIRFKRYGIDFLYPKGFSDIPNNIMQGFDITAGVIEKFEQDALKEASDKNK